MKKPAEPKTLSVGMEAPNFSLADQKGERHSLFEYRSEWVLIYFFRKHEMDSCAPGSCTLKEDFEKFQARRVYVLGISTALPEEHMDFARAFDVRVRLLSDRDKKAHKLYDVPVPRGRATLETRTAYLIDTQGKIVKAYCNADSKAAADLIMSDLAGIKETENRRVAPADERIGMPERRFRVN